METGEKMSRQSDRARITTAILSACFMAACVAQADTFPVDSGTNCPQEFTVSRTLDRKPFNYRMELSSQAAGYRVYRLTYPSPVVTPVENNNTVPADYYLPDGIEPGTAKLPAVICMHILEGDFELVHMTCSALASRGIPALMFKLPYYGERSLPGGRRALAARPKLLAESLTQAVQDVRRTVDVLASRPEVDPRRIGITGISLGGIVAATAAGAEPRLARAAMLLAGGDLMTIIHHARETRLISQTIRGLPPAERNELRQRIEEVDPLQHAFALRRRARDGKVLMINADQDEVIPKSCTQKLAAALGIQQQVVWLEGMGHYTALAALPRALRTTVEFFAEDLPKNAKPRISSAGNDQPLQKVASLLSQVSTLILSKPAPGRCHLVDLDFSVTRKDGKPLDGRLRLIRGSQQRFRLECKLPEIGEAALGQGAYPWIAAGRKAVFVGAAADGTMPGDPFAHAEQQHLLRLQMLSGILAATAVAPELLTRWITVADLPSPDGTPGVRITQNDQATNSLHLTFDNDAARLRKVTFQVEGVRGTVNLHAWELNAVAHRAVFEEPENLPKKQVDSADLYRMFSAMFNFAMEAVQ